jgi:hypothetical protein
MNTDGNIDGTLSFGTALDTSGFDEGAQLIEEKVAELGDKAEAESARIREAFADVPTVNIDFVTNAAESLQTIDDAFAEIDRVVDTNKQQIQELEAEYQRLSVASAKAMKTGADKEYNQMQQDMQAIKQLIAARKDAIKYAEKTADELLKVEQKLKDEAAAAAKAETNNVSLKSRLRELTMQLVELERAGKRGTEEFQAIQKEAAELKDRIADAQAQVNILANDQAGFQGMLSVMGGVSGGFTALTGVMSLFGNENKDLQKVMTKLQSVMAITMGLQQVQAMLNKDSAASLVVLNGLKEWWAKITIQATAAQTAEAAATVADTEALAAESIAEEVNATAKTTNVAATEAEVAADTAEAAASGVAAAAEGVQTAAIVGETAAATAGTAANWSLAAAFRAVGLAIKSIPVIGWILAGISALIAVISTLTGTEEENTEAIEENKEKVKEQIEAYNARERVMREAASISAKEKAQIETLSTVIHDNTAALEDRRKALDELNRIIPEYNGLLSDEGILTSENTQAVEDYINALDKLAMAKALQNELEKLSQKEVENQIRQRRAQRNVNELEGYEYYDPWSQMQSAYGGGSVAEIEESMSRARERQAELIENWGVWNREDLENVMTEAQSELKNAQKEATDIAADREDLLKMMAEMGLQGDILQTVIEPDKNHNSTPFDAEGAALRQKQALDEWQSAVRRFIQNAEDAVGEFTLNAMAENQAKQLAQIDANAEELRRSWIEKLMGLAEAKMRAEKQIYMAQEGATEVGWAERNGNKSDDELVADYYNQLLQQKDIKEKFDAVMVEIEEKRLREIAALQQSYTDALIEDYGTTEQKMEKLEREWMQRIAMLPPEFVDEATRQMENELASMRSVQFKDLIDWDSVFGDLDNQSIQSLRANLDRIRAYFEQNKEAMSATEIKDYTEAIKRMEDEIASRNPFEAMHKSLKDIATAKTELISAMNEYNAAQQNIIAAQTEYNAAQEYYNQLQAEVMNGDLTEDSEEMVDAKNRLADAQTRLNQAEERGVKAENNVIKGRNNLTTSYRNFATQLKNCGSVISGVGTNAKNLASVFSKDLADSMEKGIDFMDEIVDAASSVINALADVGKGAATGIEAAVEASADGSTAAAAAGATAISTIEKASVILTVISAALQVATAIASLFNNDDAKNEQIERLQKRIDQLQWELNNQDIVRFNREYLDILEQVNTELENSTEYVRQFNDEYLAAQAEADAALRAYYENMDQESSDWLYMEYLRKQAVADHILQLKSEDEAVERLADAWVDVHYNTTRALGEERYENVREKIENLTKQVILLQEQLEAEQDKKNPDDEAVQEYQQEIQETAFEAANVVKDMMEEIIGSSAADIASQLGEAFIEAAAQGEDAMEAWHKKVNDIVADVMKRMMIQKFLEEPIGNLFNEMQKKWFNDDGSFKGIQAVLDSSQEFADGLNNIGTSFQEIWETLPDDLKQWFGMDEREGSQRGIATASQDSVDENNARLTTIQGHTYSLVQGLEELNDTASLILDRVTGIEANTNEANNKLDNMGNRVRNIENTVDDIQRNGIRIRS